MRILQVYSGPYQTNRGGGMSVYVRNISERLAKRHDVTVFGTAPPGFPRFEVVNGVKVERFKRVAPSGAYFFSMDMLLRLRKSDFDVVHGHGYQSLPLHLSTFAKKRKFIASTHYHGVGHSSFRSSLMKVLRRAGQRTLEKADKVVAVSEYERSLLRQQFKLDPYKMAVIPCGVDYNEFRGLVRHKHKEKSVLYVGRLESYKGAQYLIEVMPKLDDDWNLEIVGNGPMKPLLESRASELGIRKRVEFYQGLPRKELLQKFADADVFVLLSRYEAYSMVIAEALVAGTPCIVAKGSALTEWVDNENCFGIDYPLNIPRLAQLIEQVSEHRNESGGEGLRKDKIKDWNHIVEEYEKIYSG
jgi:glycosyltransferase involved in cell wall biosynthesis